MRSKTMLSSSSLLIKQASCHQLHIQRPIRSQIIHCNNQGLPTLAKYSTQGKPISKSSFHTDFQFLPQSLRTTSATGLSSAVSSCDSGSSRVAIICRDGCGSNSTSAVNLTGATKIVENFVAPSRFLNITSPVFGHSRTWQASLKAEDILNSWPEIEVERIRCEYGESNWYFLQNKIIKCRLHGGLHSTGELINLIQNSTPGAKGRRQGWIKTATRVFQGLRITVNDEPNTLESSLHDCFKCLSPGSRLAVISFHSLEDRIVKQTFLNIMRGKEANVDDGLIKEIARRDGCNANRWKDVDDGWIKQEIQGRRAKLRVIQKI